MGKEKNNGKDVFSRDRIARFKHHVISAKTVKLNVCEVNLESQ